MSLGAFYGRIDLGNILHEELICSLKSECNFGDEAGIVLKILSGFRN